MREGSVCGEKEASHPALVSVISRGRALSGNRVVVLPEVLTASSLLPPAAEEVLMEGGRFHTDGAGGDILSGLSGY